MYKHKKFNDKFPEYLPKLIKPPVKMKDIFSKRKEQHESIQLSHDIINAVKRQNYINEYDRINGELSRNITHGHVSHAHLTARKERLKQLFHESFIPQMHELYSK